MKITKIQILNYLGIANFNVSKLGKLNKISGGNGTGKSTVIKAITEAFKSSGVNPNIIKIGEDKAEILIEIDDRISIQRNITHTSNTAKVVVDEQPMGSPQKFIKSLIGGFNFNPVEFFLSKPKERRQILLSSIEFTIDEGILADQLSTMEVPIDLTQFDYGKHGLEVLDDIKKFVYEARKEQNHDVVRLKKAIETDYKIIPDSFDSDAYKDFNLSDKIKQMNEQASSQTEHFRDSGQIENMRRRSKEILNEIERKEADIKSIQYDIEQLKTDRVNIQVEGKALSEKISKFVMPDNDIIQAEIDGYEEAQKLIHKLDEIETKKDDLKGVEDKHTDLDKLYKALTGEIPRSMLKQVKLPIEGLEIKGDNILVDGVNIDQLSTSEQMKFSTSIAKSLAGELKVICIDRYESLDESSRKIFEKDANKDGFEYFMTVVTDGELNMDSQSPAKPAKKEAKPKQRDLGDDSAGF